MSVVPEVMKPGCGQLRIADCVLDVSMPQVMLDRARVVSLIGELVTSSMTEHVRMYRKVELGEPTCAGKHLSHGRVTQGATALTHKDVG